MAILLMGLALALTYPSLSRGSSSLHLRATARDILNTLRYAREKAITEQMAMKVTIDPEAQQVILSDLLGEGSRAYIMPRNVRIQRIALAGQELVDGPLSIRFLPNGSSDKAEILLKSDKGSFLRIITDPLAGGARIVSGQPEDIL